MKKECRELWLQGYLTNLLAVQNESDHQNETLKISTVFSLDDKTRDSFSFEYDESWHSVGFYQATHQVLHVNRKLRRKIGYGLRNLLRVFILYTLFFKEYLIFFEPQYS